MDDDVNDAKDIAARIEAASSSERKTLWSTYIAWIFRGARAQGWRGAVGMPLLGLSAFVALQGAVYGLQSIWIYALSAFGVLVGLILVRVGFRRERDWRREHPFKR